MWHCSSCTFNSWGLILASPRGEGSGVLAQLRGPRGDGGGCCASGLFDMAEFRGSCASILGAVCWQTVSSGTPGHPKGTAHPRGVLTSAESVAWSL